MNGSRSKAHVAFAGMLLTAVSFSTALSVRAADGYTWSGGSEGAWSTLGNWTSGSGGCPGSAGDTVTISGATVTLDNSAEISYLLLDNSSLVSGSSPVELTLRSADGSSYFLLDFDNTSRFGGGVTDDNLTFAFASPTQFKGHRGGGSTNRGVFRGRLTGGTDAYPCPVRFTKDEASWNYCFHYLVNAASDFRGDVEMLGIWDQDESPMTLCLGMGDVAAEDSMLGDPKNEIYFSHHVRQWGGESQNFAENRIVLNNLGETGFNRKVHGRGTIAGRYVNDDFSESSGPLVLGNGFASDPSVIRENGSMKTEHGLQIFRGSSISIRPGATFYVDVDDKGGSDRFEFHPESAFSFTGAIVVRTSIDLPTGTSFDIGTVDKSAGSCTVNPSSISGGWQCVADGDSTSGWTLRLVKANLAPMLAVGSAFDREVSGASLSANVLSLGSETSFELLFFYGTSDGGNDDAAWQASVSAGMVSAVGVHTAKVSDLAPGSYYFRPAIRVNEQLIFADAANSFVTADEFQPATFLWRDVENSFDSTTSWVRANNDLARLLPGYAGDTIQFDLGGFWNDQNITYGSNAVVRMSGDVTIGKVYSTGGYRHYLRLLPDSGKTLTLDNLGENALIQSAGDLATFEMGAADTPSELHIVKPLEIRRDGGDYGTLTCYSKLTGGTADAPCGIKVVSRGWNGSYAVHLVNVDNDFVGDIVVSKESNMSLDFCIGAPNIIAQNGMVGNVANTITVLNGSRVKYYGTSSQIPVCERKICGTGTLNACFWANEWNSPTTGIVLSDLASLAPCGATASDFGVLTVDTTSYEDADGTVYALEVSADDQSVCDRIDFKVKSAFALRGTFVVTADKDKRIPAGARWVIGTVSADAGTFSEGRLPSTGLFRVYAESNAEGDGWTIYAERKNAGFCVMLR